MTYTNDQLLKDKIKLKQKISILEREVTETDWVSSTPIARKLRRLKTELTYTEIAYAERSA